MITQKDGVFNAVEAFLTEADRKIVEGEAVVLQTEDRKSVVEMLCAATEAGELVRKSNKAGTTLAEYWNGTLSNWLRKDERLNGGIKYEAKNPGSRAGSQDPELKNLKLLLKKVEATGVETDIEAVQQEIVRRTAQIAVDKIKKIEVNADLIPDALKHLVVTEDNE